MLTLLCAVFLFQEPAVPLPVEPKTGSEWNQAGVTALETGDYERALYCFAQAKTLLPEDETISLNLSRGHGQLALQHYQNDRLPEALDGFQTAFKIHRDAGTPEILAARCLLRLGRRAESLEMALLVHRDFPNLEGPPLLAADIYALRLELEQGIEILEKIDSPSKKVSSRLQQLREEHRAWEDYLRDKSLHFEVLYDPKRTDIVQVIPEIIQDLENACVGVSNRFGLLPAETLVVFVLDKDKYREQAPEWSAGLYDGRIRLSVGDYQKEKESLRTTLRHEYAHAVLHTLGAQLPSWFQEGIAQLVENRSLEDANNRTGRSLNSGIRLGKIQGDWTSWKNPSSVRAAYSYSLCFTNWIEEEFGAHTWPLLFDSIRQRGLEDALQAVLGYSSTELDQRFARNF